MTKIMRKKIHGRQQIERTTTAMETDAAAGSGGAQSVAAGDAAPEAAHGLVAVDGIHQPDEGSVSDAGKEPSASVPGEENAKAESAGAVATGGEDGSEISAVASAGSGSGVDAAEHQGGHLPGNRSASEPPADGAGDKGRPGASGDDRHGDAAATATDGDTGGGNPASGNDGGEGAEGVAAAQPARVERHGGRLYVRGDGDENDGETLTVISENPRCFICQEVFKPSDLCATDINEGTCHAACLDGAPVVSLVDGEPMAGPASTFLYVEELIDELGFNADVNAALYSADGDKLKTVFKLAKIGAGVPPMPNFAKDCPPAGIASFGAHDAFLGAHMATDIAGAIIAGREPLKTSPLSCEALSDLVAFVRKIGRRATPDILAQQLVITKHRETAALTRPEEIGLRAFISVLLDLDDFAAAEQACRDVEQAKPVERKPLPMDETTMETVDGPMETWR